MDDWGDPWADDDGQRRTLQPPSASFARPAFSAVLNGFQDDAQWGDWTSQETTQEPGDPVWNGSTSYTKPKPLVDEESVEITTAGPQQTAPSARDSILSETPFDDADVDIGGWEKGENPVEEELTARWTDGGESHTDNCETRAEPNPAASSLRDDALGSDWNDEDSSTTTTITAESPAAPRELPVSSAVAHAPAEEIIDDDQSTQTSTSPSDASHADESPRTSVDEEQKATKKEQPNTNSPGPTPASEESSIDKDDDGDDGDDGFGEFADGAAEDDSDENEGIEAPKHEKYTVEGVETHNAEAAYDSVEKFGSKPSDPVVHQTPLRAPTVPFRCDLSTISEFFKPPTLSDDMPVVETPISATSARKMWYRLARKETMREFNSGQDDENYVRVAWLSSTVRKDVNEVIRKWASEDRATGRATFGARGGAMFGWDQPADKPFELPKRASRLLQQAKPSKPSVVTQAPQPSKSRQASVSTSTPVAQFGWSSSPAVENTETNDGIEKKHAPPLIPPPRTRSSTTASSDVVPDGTAIHDLEGGPVRSLISSHRTSLSGDTSIKSTVKHNHSRTSSKIHNLGEESLGLTVKTTESSRSKAPLESKPTAPAHISIAPVDDDDDWGEMVQSPSITTPLPSYSNNEFPKPSSPVGSTMPSNHPDPWQLASSEPPTFDAPINNSNSPISQKSSTPFTASETTTDPWASVDFSFFDTPPAPTSVTKPPTHSRTPSVPTAVLSAVPARLKSPRPLSMPPTPFASTPQPTPAPIQPLTHEQREQARSDGVIRDILAGLPNIAYMLQ